jgi:hypothetical protein
MAYLISFSAALCGLRGIATFIRVYTSIVPGYAVIDCEA